MIQASSIPMLICVSYFVVYVVVVGGGGVK
jgi:hypothetical protein